jgi:hypothetical protein
MATVEARNEYRQKLSWFLSHRPHQLWDQFTPDQQEEMVSDDLSAGLSVSIELASLIATGMILCIATLAAVILMS